MNTFFRAGMGTRLKNNTWRYRRKEMGLFIAKYQAISIPAFDLERIEGEDGLESIVVEESSTGYKYICPIEAIAQGSHKRMNTWSEPEQFFIPIECWQMKVKGSRKPQAVTVVNPREAYQTKMWR